MYTVDMVRRKSSLSSHSRQICASTSAAPTSCSASWLARVSSMPARSSHSAARSWMNVLASAMRCSVAASTAWLCNRSASSTVPSSARWPRAHTRSAAASTASVSISVRFIHHATSSSGIA